MEETPFPDELRQLVVDMGFLRERALLVLRATNGDLGESLELLFSWPADGSVPAAVAAAAARAAAAAPAAPPPTAAFSLATGGPVPERELMRLARLDTEAQEREFLRQFPSLELAVIQAVLYSSESLEASIDVFRELASAAAATAASASANQAPQASTPSPVSPELTASSARRAECLVVRLSWLDREQQVRELSRLWPTFEPDVIRTVLNETDSLTKAIDIFFGFAAVALQEEDHRRRLERKQRRQRLEQRVRSLLAAVPHASRDLDALSARFPYLPLSVLIDAYDGNLEAAVAHLHEHGVRELNTLESAAMDQTLSQFQNTAQYAERLASMSTRELRRHLLDRRRERHAEVDVAMRFVIDAIDRFGLPQGREVRTNVLFLRVTNLDNALERASVRYMWQLFTCDEWDPESMVAPPEIREVAQAQALTQLNNVFDELGIQATDDVPFSVEYNAATTVPPVVAYTMPQRALPEPTPIVQQPYAVAEPASPVVLPAPVAYTMPQRALPEPTPVVQQPYAVAEPASPVVLPIPQPVYAVPEPVAQPYAAPVPAPVPAAAAAEPKAVLSQLPTADAQQLLQHVRFRFLAAHDACLSLWWLTSECNPSRSCS